MKKINVFAASVLSVLGVGCVCISTAPGNVAVAEKEESHVKQVGRPAKKGPREVIAVTVAEENSAKLRVVFKWADAENNFSRKLAERLAEKVVLDNADVVSGSAGDVAIVLKPEFELVDKSGNYYRYKCTRITASIASKQKIYALKTVELKDLPRKNSVQSAKDQYLVPAVEAIAPFLKAELEKITKDLIAVRELKFTLPRLNISKTQSAAIQIDKIAKELNSVPGIIAFSIAQQDVRRAYCTFRVVYLKNHFPQGITNELNLRFIGK